MPDTCGTNSCERSLNMSEILTPNTVELGASLGSRDEAIRRAGALLVENGHVDERYVDSMFEREKSVSTSPGATFVSRIGRPSRSSRSACVKPWTANFDVT